MAKRIWLPNFNPSWEFVAVRELEVGGYGLLKAGDRVPKHLHTNRRLRQLYELHHIEPATDPIPKPVKKANKPMPRYEVRGAGPRWSVYLGDELVDGPFMEQKARRIAHHLNKQASDEAA